VPADDAERRLRSAREALAAARQDAADRDPGSRGGQASQRRRPPQSGQDSSSERTRGNPPAHGLAPARDDPQPLGAAIRKLLAERGWQQQVAVGSAFGRWEQIVGPELAAHARPDGLADGELTVLADSTAWATQLRLLAATLIRRLNAELGDGTVKRVKVRGPAGPPRQPGAWRTRDGRGPRDTYG
jgi:predicted nucleic acid-binding Zn ribbon protein